MYWRLILQYTSCSSGLTVCIFLGRYLYTRDKEVAHYKDRSKTLSLQLDAQKARYVSQKKILVQKQEDVLGHLNKQIKSLEDSRRRAEDEAKKAVEQARTIGSKLETEHEVETNKLLKEIKALKDTIMDKQGQIDTLNKYKIEREQLIEEITALKANLEKEKSDNKVEVKTLERQMFETTERLQKEMVRKITEAKEQLMAVNDEQLSTTTKLTILQNHQLNVELEFQAKQAEKLVKENVQLQGQLTELKREIELHKQVEGEMAKKCYYYQRLIKKLKVAENEETQKKNQAELIKFLENKLDESAKKYEKFQTEYNKLQTECKKLQEMPDKTKFTRAGLLLVDFLENLLNSPESLQNYKDVFLDIEKLQKRELTLIEKLCPWRDGKRRKRWEQYWCC
eukprot:TRINITY_DN9305_c0_g4_i1.p2 TRINITY_DN9305_c0_g4~~TRINITY_DN9305_c0_g4_i1.p2  ORF type:complete len:396 (-),score=68.56 TRINITY_DN9305_c0_g4_i1:6505-7692(-)